MAAPFGRIIESDRESDCTRVEAVEKLPDRTAKLSRSFDEPAEFL
jgi:hypothetical protein